MDAPLLRLLKKTYRPKIVTASFDNVIHYCMRQINVYKWFCYNLRLPAYFHSSLPLMENHIVITTKITLRIIFIYNKVNLIRTLTFYLIILPCNGMQIFIMCIRRPICYQMIVSWKDIWSDIFPYRLWIELKHDFRVIWYLFCQCERQDFESKEPSIQLSTSRFTSFCRINCSALSRYF